MTAPKRDQNWENIPRETALLIAQNRFGGDGWEYLQTQFDRLNTQFFGGELPPTLILTGRHGNGEAGRYYGKAIYVTASFSQFKQTLVLIHEMKHLENRLRNIQDYSHGLDWVNSLQHIHSKLNIRIETKDFTEAWAKSWPLNMLIDAGLYDYFERSFEEYGELRPLPSGWRIEKKEIVSPTIKEVVCRGGDIAADLMALEKVFGVEYIQKIREIICNTKF